MEVPLWKQTMLSPEEYSKYANISRAIIYDFCQRQVLPCIKTGRGFKIHREEADEHFRKMSLHHEGFTEKTTEAPAKRRIRK